MIVSSSCIYREEDFSEYGDERLRSYFYALFPLSVFFFSFVILSIFEKHKIWEVNSFHKYTLMNVIFFFFQPDSVAFFTQALSCRVIGNKSYKSINLLIPCEDPAFTSFSQYFILPNLLFWVLFPALIFFFLRAHVNRSNNLHFSTTKYKYGYFYLGFKR